MSLGSLWNLQFERYCLKEHISVIKVSASKYIGWINAATRIGRVSFRSVVLYLSEQFYIYIPLDDAVVVGCDDTFLNTYGKKWLYKMPMAKRLQW